jgi:thiamine-phosphate pyrophosphorylase
MVAHAEPRVTRRRRAELLHGIYVIVNEDGRALELTRAVLDAGVRVVQYRAKRGVDAQCVRSLRALTREYDALLIMNDDWRAAETFDCDGVHLGPEDAGFDRLATIRAALPERLVGLSCGTIAEARDAGAGGADYLGVGSIYATVSKSDAGAPIGIEGLRAIAGTTALPIAAIGGIAAATAGDVRRGGAAMAAVISAIALASEPRRAARDLIEAWNR